MARSKKTSSGGTGSTGGTAQACVQKGSLLVLAHLTGDSPEPFKAGLDLTVAPGGLSGKTDGSGVKEFPDLMTNTYRVTASLTGANAQAFELVGQTSASTSVPAGGSSQVNFDVAALAQLTVTVKSKPTGGGAAVTLKPEKVSLKDAKGKFETETKPDGTWVFKRLHTGTVQVMVKLTPEDAAAFEAPPDSSKVALKPGNTNALDLALPKLEHRLRLVLAGPDLKALSGKTWSLGAPLSVQGATGADGLIETAPLKPGKMSVALKVALFVAPPAPPAPTPPGPAPAEPPAKPLYPRPVVVAEFKDAAEAAPAAETVEWTLAVDDLVASGESAVQARLGNLGFTCSAGADAAITSAAVSTYQRVVLAQKPGTGKTADIEADIKNRHDSA